MHKHTKQINRHSYQIKSNTPALKEVSLFADRSNVSKLTRPSKELPEYPQDEKKRHIKMKQYSLTAVKTKGTLGETWLARQLEKAHEVDTGAN